MKILKLEPLDSASFAPFGDVIDVAGRKPFPINQGTTQRYHHLGTIRILGDDAIAGISLARGDAFQLPLRVHMLERHPKGSQSWIPLQGVSFVVVVAPNGADDRPDEAGLRAFHAREGQGVNYHVGTWHHPLLTLDQTGDFIVIDRIGTDPNCDEALLSESYEVTDAC